MREVSKWLQLVVLAGFIFPFLVLSCNGQTLVQAEGWKLAFGVEVEVDEELAEVLDTESESIEEPGAFWVTFALLVSVALFALSYTKVASKSLAILSGLIPAALVAFWLRLTADMPSTAMMGFEIVPGFGFWWVLVLSLIATGLLLWEDIGSEALQRIRGSPTRGASGAYCTQCGGSLKAGDRFCASCGAPART